MLQKFNLDKTYTGTEEATGEDYNVEADDEGPRPFTALLDTGLKRTSTGSKVFAALKVSYISTCVLACCWLDVCSFALYHGFASTSNNILLPNNTLCSGAACCKPFLVLW